MALSQLKVSLLLICGYVASYCRLEQKLRTEYCGHLQHVFHVTATVHLVYLHVCVTLCSDVSSQSLHLCGAQSALASALPLYRQ